MLLRYVVMTHQVPVVLFWLVAAVLVATAHAALDTRSPIGGAVAEVVSVVATAYAYTRLCARSAEMPDALGVGIAWLVLAIVAELFISARLGRGWYGLLGTPARPLLRNINLFVWIFAPALYARREERA